MTDENKIEPTPSHCRHNVLIVDHCPNCAHALLDAFNVMEKDRDEWRALAGTRAVVKDAAIDRVAEMEAENAKLRARVAELEGLLKPSDSVWREDCPRHHDWIARRDALLSPEQGEVKP